jgi:hypothetical protein
MLTAPEPNDIVAVYQADDAIVIRNSSGIDGASGVDLLKLQASVPRVSEKLSVGGAGPIADLLGKIR